MAENGEISKRFRRIVLVLVAVALTNAVLTGINVYLVFQSSQNLSKQESLSKLPVSTLFLVVNADDADLGKPVVYFNQSGGVEQTVHYGNAHVAIQVAVPHYGSLAISLTGFNASGSEYLNSGMLNETEVSYSDGKARQVFVLVPGLNQISVQLPLRIEVYPQPDKIPPGNEPVKILLGNLSMEAETFDFETQAKATSQFSAEIFVELEMPS